MRHRFRLTAVCAGVLSAGCGSPDTAADPLPVAQWSIGSAPTFQVGGHGGRPEYNLFDVAAAARMSDGRVAIANVGTSQLRFYDAEGGHLLDVGGEGDGPGELRYIFQMVRGRADSLIVMSRNPGLTWYDGSGRYARSARVTHTTRSPHHPCRFGEGDTWKIRPDGSMMRLLLDDYAPASCPPTPEGVWRTTGLLGVPALDEAGFDTIVVMPADERVGHRYRVFGHSLLLGFASDRVYAADTDSDVVLGLSYTGDTLAILPTPFEPRLVPDDVKDEGLLEVRQPDGSVRFMPGYSNYPEAFPRLGRVVVDTEDYLWLMEYPVAREPFNSWRLTRASGIMVPPDGARWVVLDPSGAAVADLRTPPGFFVLEIGQDYLLGVSRDDLDVETVEMYRLDRQQRVRPNDR